MGSIGLPMEAARIETAPSLLSELLGFDESPVRVGHVELWPSEGRLSVDGREAAPRWDYIHTHFGYGYRFQPVRRRERP
jgi:hypothetical protein